MGNTNSETTPDSLPALGANPDSTIVAGFSAGSYMAHNLHVVYSDTFKGAGLVAGGSYHAESYYPLAGVGLSWFDGYERDP